MSHMLIFLLLCHKTSTTSRDGDSHNNKHLQSNGNGIARKRERERKEFVRLLPFLWLKAKQVTAKIVPLTHFCSIAKHMLWKYKHKHIYNDMFCLRRSINKNTNANANALPWNYEIANIFKCLYLLRNILSYQFFFSFFFAICVWVCARDSFDVVFVNFTLLLLTT